MTQIKNIESVLDLGFRVHSVNLLHDIILNQIGPNAGVLKVPLNNFQYWLATMAERCTELNDPELNIICLSMGLYEANPSEIGDKIEAQIKLMKYNSAGGCL
jgi:hypothetical protein